MSADVNNEKDGNTQVSSSPETNQSDEICSICLESIKNSSSINSCTHKFCFECIHRWSKVSNTCPLCQARFTFLTKLQDDDNEENEDPNSIKRRRSQRASAKKANKRLKGNRNRIRIPFRDIRRHDDIDDYRTLIAQFLNHNGFVNGHNHGTFSNIYYYPRRRSPQNRIFIDLTIENDENRRNNNNNNQRNVEVICIDDDDSDIEVHQPNHFVTYNIDDDNDDLVLLPMNIS